MAMIGIHQLVAVVVMVGVFIVVHGSGGSCDGCGRGGHCGRGGPCSCCGRNGCGGWGGGWSVRSGMLVWSG